MFLNKRITNRFHESQLSETYTASEQRAPAGTSAIKRQKAGERRSEVIEVTKKQTSDAVNESDSANEVQQNEDAEIRRRSWKDVCVSELVHMQEAEWIIPLLRDWEQLFVLIS